ncbi:hypothetical protein [Megamonas hypermegale]|uniref:hypothetical protein n=1 Tax=Megamonas hypermegale TaxID=158847 RepID=UPI0026EB394B|nr:hypothetical protein [Megamonas hypermegale]
MKISGYIMFTDLKNEKNILEGDLLLEDILEAKLLKSEGNIIFNKMKGNDVKLKGEIYGENLNGDKINLEGIINLKKIVGKQISIEGILSGNNIKGDDIIVNGQVYLQYLQAKEIKLSLSKNNHIGKIISDNIKVFLDKKNDFENISMVLRNINNKKAYFNHKGKISIEKIIAENIILDHCYVDKIKCKNIILKNNCIINTLIFEKNCILEGKNEIKNKVKGEYVL